VIRRTDWCSWPRQVHADGNRPKYSLHRLIGYWVEAVFRSVNPPVWQSGERNGRQQPQPMDTSSHFVVQRMKYLRFRLVSLHSSGRSARTRKLTHYPSARRLLRLPLRAVFR
jgi:hypothetical protein